MPAFGRELPVREGANYLCEPHGEGNILSYAYQLSVYLY